MRRRRRAQIRRNRLTVASVCACLAIVGWLATSLTTGGSQNAAASRHIATKASISALASFHRVVPGVAPSGLGWPVKGQAAVAAVGMGVMARSPGATPVPIASLTKMMTALILLHDHPLALGDAGPVLQMTAADVDAYVAADQSDESNVPIALGERLSEYQLLEALLMPSADNVADRLAIYDAGTIAAFVRKMNVTARSLGMRETHYADASGVNPSSRSTAADQALIAAQLMSDPVIRSIVIRRSVPFPVAGTIYTVNPGLGKNGVIGVKSGYTSQALGCLANAAYESVGKQHVLVVAVTTGQPDGLYGAANVDAGLLAEAARSFVLYRPIGAHKLVGELHVPWSSTTTLAQTGNHVDEVAVWPGLRFTGRLVPAPARKLTANARIVGSLELRTRAGAFGEVPLTATTQLPALPAGWNPATT